MTNIEIQVDEVEPFAEGQSFGEAGPYLRIRGVAKGELDPAAPENKVIVDLDKAPRNARGLVEYETDFFILRPTDPGRSNGVLVYDVTNRGSKRIFQRLDDAPGDPPAAANDLKTAREAGTRLFARARLQLRLVRLGPGRAFRQQRPRRALPDGNGRRPAGHRPYPSRVSHRHSCAGQGRHRAALLPGGLDRQARGAADRARPRERHPHRDPVSILGIRRCPIDPAVAAGQPVRAVQDL